MATRTVEKHIAVQESDSKTRLDKYVATHSNVPRTVFQDRSVQITVNGRREKKNYLVKDGDAITLVYTESFFEKVVPEDLPLAILYEDDDILVINKASGMVVHPASGNWDGTLVGALLFRYGSGFLGEEGEKEMRPGIVHRLDKETSGTMVVARNSFSQRCLVEQFKAHTTRKVYIAIVKGWFASPHGIVDTGMKRAPGNRKKFCTCPQEEGKRAYTEYTVLKRYQGCSLLSITIKTGRTHQIRVHMASLGHPVIGDSLYGKGEEEGMMLHSFSLSFDHPGSGMRITFKSPMPKRFKSFLHSHRSRTF